MRRWAFPAPDGGGLVAVHYPFVLDTEGGGGSPWRGGGGAPVVHRVVVSESHYLRRCSDAARSSLEDRQALWRERLGQVSGPSAWVDVYERAIRDCEASTWRERRSLLGSMLARAGSLDAMIDLYRLFGESSARSYFRAAILRRVRTPDDLRRVRDAFGLSESVD